MSTLIILILLGIIVISILRFLWTSRHKDTNKDCCGCGQHNKHS